MQQGKTVLNYKNLKSLSKEIVNSDSKQITLHLNDWYKFAKHIAFIFSMH